MNEKQTYLCFERKSINFYRRNLGSLLHQLVKFPSAKSNFSWENYNVSIKNNQEHVDVMILNKPMFKTNRFCTE